MEGLKEADYKVFEDMICRKNLTMAELLEIIDIRYQESNTHYWSVPEEVYEFFDFNETLSIFNS